MDRQRARTCPGSSDPGGTGPASDGDAPQPGAAAGRSPWRGGRRLGATAVLVTTLLAAAGALYPSGTASASPTAPSSSAVMLAAPAPTLVLLSQTGWVTTGQTLDLQLRVDGTNVPTADLGINVSVFSCLSSVSGFDQSVASGPTGTPVSSTTSPLAVSALPTLSGGGIDLRMPVVIGSAASGSSAAVAASPFTIHLLAAGEQCQSFPSGVFPVRVQLMDTSGGSVLGSITTHLIFTEAPADTQRLRVGIVLPVQITQRASRSPSSAELLSRPAAALATPSDAALTATTATIATIATAHPTVPVTMEVSGQTVNLLATTSHPSSLAQLAQLASSPDVHQLTAAPFTPVDATALVDAGLASELGLQVTRGVEVVSAASDRPAPVASVGLGAWIAGGGLDAGAVSSLASDGFRQVVLPTRDLSSSPANGSTTQPFSLTGSHGSAVTAMASDDDLSTRFVSNSGNPVLAAHQLVAELAQLYYERPNGVTPRAVMAVAPEAWTDNPVFVDALLGALDGNPMVQAVTTSQVFALFPAPAACRSGCRLTSPGASAGLPVSAIRAQRTRVNGFADATPQARTPALQLSDLVLGSEAEALRPGQQSAVVANAGAALDAQLGQLAVEGDTTVTLTASSGLVPVTVVSSAPYPVSASLILSSDKLLFPNGETQWSMAVTLQHRSNVVYVRVRSRASGVFRLDVSLRSPDGTLRLATGQLSVRSTSSSVVGIVLTVGAVVVLAMWWFRTSMKRRAGRRVEEAGGAPDGSDDDTHEGADAPGAVPTDEAAPTL